jgi:hypothetical protein
METVKPRPRTHWLVIVACLLVSLFCLLYPIYVIRPFRPQGVRELAAALLVMRFRTIVTGACVVLALWSTVRYWRQQSRPWRRVGAVTGAMGVCALAALSRVNVYELMFHPLGSPAFESAGESRLDKDEKVIAIEVNGAARAYPIRGMSYHHIVNDTVGGVPIVATY